MTSTAAEFVCPECAEAGVAASWTRADNLAKHREKHHGVERQKRAPRERPAATSERVGGGTKLQRDLAKAHLGLSIGVITFTNPTVLGNRAAVDLLEKQSNEWAGATYAVARQDERIMRTIEAAMKAGVWAAFLAQTAGSALTVAAMTGKVAVPYGAAVFLVPDLATLMTQQQPATPEPPTPNGDGPPQAEL